MPTWDPRANDLFLKALELDSRLERGKFLEEACGGDTALRGEVEALLDASARAEGFLEPPALPRTINEPIKEQPGAIIGPYKLLEQIGEGGFGVVFMAEQHEPVRRKVALKVLKPGMDSRQVVARFEAERQALAIMDHPNIAKVFDGGIGPSGRPFFVMELVKGTPITTYCDQNQLTPRQRLEIFVPVCQAVQHAHQKGIIHRDLKPSNVLVAMHDSKPVVKVIDFGVAKAVGQELTDKTLFTGFAQMIGTPLYMSPEQAGQSSLDIDTRSDIYSLGVLLYELLTGTTPFDRERFKKAAFDEIRRIIREEEPPKPSSRLSASKDSLPSVSARRQTAPAKLTKLVRGELDWIVLKCLEKDRNRRYETANGLAMDVQRYLNDELVLASPPSAIYRLRKFVKRNRGSVAATAAVVLALLAGILGTTIGMLEARAAEARMQEEAHQKEIARADEAQQRHLAEVEKNRAVEAENEAKSQAAIAHAVNRFLQFDLLGQADISNQSFRPGAAERNRNITVGELLDRAAKAIAGKFTNQPAIEAEIRFTIGRTYIALGRFPDAHTQLERTLQLHNDHLGANHPNTLIVKKELGFLYFYEGEYRRAEPLLRSVVEATVAQTGVSAPSTLYAMNSLAVVIKHQGRFAEAEQLYRDVIRGLEEHEGAAGVNTLSTKLNLAVVFLEDEKYEEGERLMGEVCSGFAAKLGPDHPKSMLSKHVLATIYTAHAKYAEAEKLETETLHMREQKLGADHPDTIISRGVLATIYSGTGRFAEAERLRVEVLRGHRAKYGDQHDYTLAAAGSLAMIYRDIGKLDEAARLIEEWLPRGQTALGATNPQVQYVMDAAATIYERRGDPAKAEPLRRELVAVVKQQRGADSTEYAKQLVALGANLVLQKKTDAQAMLREAVAIYEQKQPDSWKAFNAKSTLGGSLLLTQQFTEAEPLLLKGYQGVRQRQDTMSVPQRRFYLSQALERLVRLYEATNKNEDAANWRKELETVKAADGPAKPDAPR